MLLELRQQRDIALLLFGDLKSIGTGDALTFRMHGSTSISFRENGLTG
jgi:hypothetical protein